MNNKALVFLEAAKLHFEKFRTFFHEAGYAERSLLIPEAEEKIYWLGRYLEKSIKRLAGGEDDEEAEAVLLN
ncbi:MAG TPA: hypothetical protein EYG91_04050 [Aquifex aeolicus]|nr:hypothetical protein [Aquifex aeolicus]